MKSIRLKAPAKINLTLKVGKKNSDGFHPIESIMQAIDLCDYIDVKTNTGAGCIKLSGTSKEIPYDERNIAYKAAKKYLEISGLSFDINIFIEKNIPVSAGLAGGSTDAAAVLFGLNKIYKALDDDKIFQICAILGSDLNFCMRGSKQFCTGKGDIMTPVGFENFALTLVKPKNLSISAKEAYQKFDELKAESDMPNDLEFALLPYYEELQFLHGLGLQMSGSGPSYFALRPHLEYDLDNDYLVIENLHAINHGILEI